MQQLSKTSLAKVEKYFDGRTERVFTEKSLATILRTDRARLGVRSDLTFGRFVESLLKEAPMRRLVLQSASYGSVSRYAWRQASPYAVALSLRPSSYLSHGTALSLHGLTEQVPSVIYANKEQSLKPLGGELSQESIDRAFARPQRKSNYVFRYDGSRIVLISGKSTGNLGVAPFTAPSGETLQVTGIERTLIDIVVRPAYAGGVFQVLEAFKAARDRVSLPFLLGILRQLGYSYPYHQALGVYLEASGFLAPVLEELRGLGMPFNFYLAHGLRGPVYVSSWKTFIPEGFPIEPQSR